MAYILKGDRSGTVRFTPSLGTISAEGATFTNKVTSSQVESGGSINDHAANDPIKLSIGGTVLGSSAADALQSMCQNRDLIEYQGRRRYRNMIITSLNIQASIENKNGFEFTLSLQQVIFVTAQTVNIAVGNRTSNSRKSSRGSSTKNGGLVTTSTQTVSTDAYLKSVNDVVAKKNNNNISSARQTQSDSGYAR